MRKKIAILGAGGLGKAAAQLLSFKKEFVLVGMCDSQGYLYRPEGLDTKAITALDPRDSILKVEGAQESEAGIEKLFAHHQEIDGFFLALPNLPNTFIPNLMKQAFEEGVSSCFSDALKRTSACELLFELDEPAKQAKAVYIAGCGATPGILSAAAVVAAQSFVEVEEVTIHWGVGIGNWDAYRATVREDIAHQEGMDVEKAKAMSEAEVESYLEEREWQLTFKDMEHADDILLKRAGVVDDLEKVHVGGLLDLKSAKKPVTTTMTVTGKTFDGKRSSHKFMLGDETSMAANVLGPALGYLKRAIWLRERGIYGVFGSTEFMPQVVQ